MYSGPPPWKGLEVNVIQGPHKPCRGIVQDVRRCDSASGLQITLELFKHTVNGTNPHVIVGYDDVQEVL